MNAKNKTRRDFIKTGTTAGVGATAVAGLIPKPVDAQETVWDQEFDVVVVGAGSMKTV